jgi:histidine triad (HIT) family protein
MTISHADCIFCRIAAGKIPCHKLHEDKKTLAFLDIGPLSRGHCLIIPKDHYDTIDQMPAELVQACTGLLPALSLAVVEAVGVSDWNILQNNGGLAGQAVGHVHFHIIPRREDDGLGYRWPAGKLDADEAIKLVRDITSKLNQRCM